MISYETNVVGFSEEMIRDAISYEIQRNGQVFFINNRIENIKEVAGMIQRLVPNAKLELATDKWKEAGRIDVGFHEWRI
jgi:transcription-repair coupling factor (superfamily II helicase)